jgi:hypothetical protein
MRNFAVVVTVVGVACALAGSTQAARYVRRGRTARYAPSTVVEPTRTIIHNPDGTVTIIVTPHRSFLDPGEVTSVGDGKNRDYILAPGGDPGTPSWFYGTEPDLTGAGGYPLPRPFYLPGYNPATPF